MPVLAALRAVPIEVYPLAGMMLCGLGFGGYVAAKHIRGDQDVRYHFDRQAVQNHWRARLDGKL
ncbi:hypothetical protein HDU96_009785 [Phlyctochytrium bullatum]|nr:hypothetical protein HDU96_009785 [Phlyctochytrium bullatum]